MTDTATPSLPDVPPERGRAHGEPLGTKINVL